MSFSGLLNVSPVDLFFSLSMGFAVVLISPYFLTDFGCNYTYFFGFYKMEKFRLTIPSFFFFELESHVAKVGPELALQKRMAFNLFCPASPTQILKLLLLLSARLLNFKCFYFLHFLYMHRLVQILHLNIFSTILDQLDSLFSLVLTFKGIFKEFPLGSCCEQEGRYMLLL